MVHISSPEILSTLTSCGALPNAMDAFTAANSWALARETHIGAKSSATVISMKMELHSGSAAEPVACGHNHTSGCLSTCIHSSGGAARGS